MSLNKNKISNYIKSLLPLDDSASPISFDGFSFSLKGYGSLWLTKDDIKDYRSILNSIIKEMNLDLISEKGIEKLFQASILKSIDLENRHPDLEFDSRIKKSIDELESQLKATPKKYSIYYPIDGVEKTGLPFKFGKIDFRVFNEDDLSIFNKAVLDYEGNEKKITIRKDLLNKLKNEGLFNKVVAKMEVKAIDCEAGMNQAKKEISLTVDVLNFYSDLIDYHKGFVYLPGRAQPQSIIIPMIEDSEKPYFQFNWLRVGPLMPVNFNKLIESDNKYNLGLEVTSKLLVRKEGKFQERLLSAMRWAGSATSEIDNEKSFLRYAISLETIILQEGNAENVSYRIRTRIAQLLSETFTRCCEIERQIKNLYDIRSKIVHNGEYQVTDSDLFLIRYYSKNCILKLLVDAEFMDINQEEFLNWFLKRTYR